MEPVIQLLYTAIVYLSILTLLFAPFGLYFSSNCLKTMHFNLRVLILTLGLLWCIFPVGGIIFHFILDASENPPQLYQLLPYQIGKNIWATTGYAFRVFETSICFERFLATVFFRTYERQCIFRIYSFFAVIFSISLAACFSLLFNILHIPALAVYIFLFTVETINFVLLFILRRQNHKLRKMSNSKRALLTSKYQLIENITSLNLLLPQASISFVISNFSIVSSFVIGEFYEPVRVPIFFSLYSLNVIIISIYWVSRSKWFKAKMEAWKQKFSTQLHFHSNEVRPFRAVTVRTTLGQKVKAQQTIDEHFIDLKALWK